MDPLATLLDAITLTRPGSRASLHRLKARVATASGGPLIRNDALLARYRHEVAGGRRPANREVERILTLNRIRSESGVATVTVITEPFPCPGRCVYCPTEALAPKSYLTNEPAVRRALRHDYDPFRQVVARLQSLTETGHPTEKVELIIKGGTWSFYPDRYQETFLRRCFEAANEFAQGSGLRAAGSSPQPRTRSPQLTLEAAQRMNETAASRVIGVTIETRPDYIDPAELLRLRRLGVTRVELGVQTLEEAVLTRIVRDHGTAEVRAATQGLKDAGFKVAYHLMPNLPGATPASDAETMRRLFAEAAYRPDALKLYPCVVVKSAELHAWWRDGRYTPYDDETLVELLLAMKCLTPPWVRIERVIRDIPTPSIAAGCPFTNLREVVQQRLRDRGLRCRCIRCRQVREDGAGTWTLTRRVYEASGGTELFLSFEDPARDRLAALLRLRLPSTGAQPVLVPALAGAALIRELHTYGLHTPLAARWNGAPQHRGLGARLVQEAEQIAREEYGRTRLAVIAGVGVRAYYRRLGYRLQDTYMVKTLTKNSSSSKQ